MIRRPHDADFDVEDLRRMNRAALVALWPRVMGRAPMPCPARQRWLLVRTLAWRIQEQRPGACPLDAETQRLLNAAVRAAPHGRAERPPDEGARAAEVRSRSNGTAPNRPSVRRLGGLPPPGSLLVRTFRATEHEVKIVRGPKGAPSFIYRGKAYRSLTAIAREITGGARSGPRFFGLASCPRRAGRMKEDLP